MIEDTVARLRATLVVGAWSKHAACRDVDPDVMFPVDKAGVFQAKERCRQCPVREQCLEHALAAREDHGVWGGLDEDERRRVLKARARRTPSLTEQRITEMASASRDGLMRSARDWAAQFGVTPRTVVRYRQALRGGT